MYSTWLSAIARHTRTKDSLSTSGATFQKEESGVGSICLLTRLTPRPQVRQLADDLTKLT